MRWERQWDVPVKAVKREVGEDNRDWGVVMVGNDAGLNSQCAECAEGGPGWA